MSAARFDDGGGVAIAERLVATGLAPSKGEARRLIKGGGARLDDAVITDETALVHATSGTTLKLSAGRKRHALVRVS